MSITAFFRVSDLQDGSSGCRFRSVLLCQSHIARRGFRTNSIHKHQADLHKGEYTSLSCQTLEVCCFSILKDERKGKKAPAAVNFDDARLVPQLLSTWLGLEAAHFYRRFSYRVSHLHRVSLQLLEKVLAYSYQM